MLDGLGGKSSCRVGYLAEPTPGIEGGVAEELVDGAVVLVAAVLDGVVHEALAFIHGPVANGLYLELIDSIDGDCGPNIARIAVAAGADKRNAIDVNIGDGAAAAGAVDDTGVGGGVSVGLVALYTGHQISEV